MSHLLNIESLADRLHRLVPGARIIRTHSLGPTKSWTVVHGERRVSSSSEREAVDQAVTLWGPQR